MEEIKKEVKKEKPLTEQEKAEIKRLLEDKKIWYDRVFVLYEIVKCLKNRELSFITKKGGGLKSIRYLMAFKVDYLKKHFDRINFETSLNNMYQSVAVVEDMPIFSYDLALRRKEQKYKDFGENFANHVKGYDLFLDFDGKGGIFETCHKEAQEMKAIFDTNKIPYWLMNSSSNGFHFHIPAEYMPKMEAGEVINYLNSVVYNIKGVYDMETLDETVVDMKRICKVPYSFVDDGTVCLPLNDSQFKLFNKESVKAMTVLRNVTLKNRGLLLRKHGLVDEQLKENVRVFLEEFK